MDEIFATLELTIEEYLLLTDLLAEQRIDSGLASVYDALVEYEWDAYNFDDEEEVE